MNIDDLLHQAEFPEDGAWSPEQVDNALWLEDGATLR